MWVCIADVNTNVHDYILFIWSMKNMLLLSHSFMSSTFELKLLNFKVYSHVKNLFLGMPMEYFGSINIWRRILAWLIWSTKEITIWHYTSITAIDTLNKVGIDAHKSSSLKNLKCDNFVLYDIIFMKWNVQHRFTQAVIFGLVALDKYVLGISLVKKTPGLGWSGVVA